VKIVTIVGARPQFIKSAPLSLALRKRHEEILVHTGQHYDQNMSDIFFAELGIPQPDYQLNIGSGRHGEQTGRMLAAIEETLLKVKPDAVIVLGDTNSTLAGALAAAKLGLPIAHVEAGLRSYRRDMPEEINRRVADHLSHWLFAPSPTAVQNLAREGLVSGVFDVGDIMYDAMLLFLPIAQRSSRILERLALKPKQYALMTVHRAENTDQSENLTDIFAAVNLMPLPVVFPCHPRTWRALQQHGLMVQREVTNTPDVKNSDCNTHLILLQPQGYLDMLSLMSNASIILTDSGGIQKEAFWLKVPCVTLRRETEWPETVQLGWNRLAGTRPEHILSAVRGALQHERVDKTPEESRIYGDGSSSERIASILDS
jgi:UDP-N-acetylglucosamine 2-epimerase